MKKKELIASFFTATILFLGFAGQVMADPIISNPLTNVDSIPSLLCIIFDGLIFLGAPILTLVIVLAGINWMTSMGEPAKVSQARATITYAVIGIIVVLSSKAIYAFIIDALKISADACP